MKLLNIANHRRTIYLFLRDDKGKQEIRTVTNFFPYFYEISDEIEGKYRAYNGTPLKKIMVSEPKNVRQMRTEDSFESDVLFTNRYLIDRIDSIEKTSIKYFFIDIEVKSDEFPVPEQAKYPVSFITVYDSFKDKTITFDIREYESEFEMLENFCKYIKKESPDLILGWNVMFDYKYLYYRMNEEFAENISPIGKTRYGDGEIWFPSGISIIDYMTWFKNFTRNQEKRYSLNYIAQKYLEDKPNPDTDFNKISDEVKDKNIKDVKKLVRLEKKYQLINHYDEIRRFSMANWEDLGVFNSRVIDMLLLKEAKKKGIVLPMKKRDAESGEFEGAHRKSYYTGRFFNVGSYDLSGAYMYAIIDLCLDPANVSNKKSSNTIPVNITDRETKVIKETYYVKQDKEAILPIIAKKLIEEKNILKEKKKKTDPSSDEYEDIKNKYEALKTIVLSAWGVIGNKYFRMFDHRVAGMITAVVRDLIWYVEDELKKKGYKVLYVDTDGFIIDDKGKNIEEWLNEVIIKWAKERFNKKVNIVFEHEGNFEKLFIATRCRYKGYLRTFAGLEEKIKGLEIKRKDSTEYLSKFQDILLDKIMNKESKDKIFNWIKNEIKNLKNKPLKEIAFPCKISKPIKDYKSVPIFARALENTENFKRRIGQSYYWIYIKPQEKPKRKTQIIVKGYLEGEDYKEILDKDLSRSEGIEYITNKLELEEDKYKISILHRKEKPKNVIAFDEETQDNIDKNIIDWKLMIERNILMKLETPFTAMGWEVKEIK